MESTREQLLELLRSSLWGTEPSQELFAQGVEWSSLLDNARRQSVLGAIYSQIEGLEDRPPRATMMRLHTLTTLNRKMQLKQLTVLATIVERLREVGIMRPVLLKGLGVMSNYLDPGVRQCGDIDLYVGKEHYEAACALAAEWTESITDKKSKSLKHFHFHFDGIPIEIHRIATSSNNISRHGAEFERWCVEQLEGEDLRVEVIEGVELYLPPYNFDAIYVFYHAWDHFCSYGISFRQICDWCRYLVVHHDRIDQERLLADLEYFGLIRPWSFFGAVAVSQLGLGASYLTGFDPAKDWRTERICEKIWQGGNFGFYDPKNATGKGYNIWLRKMINFFSLFNSFMFLFSIDRRYSWNYLIRTPLKHIKGNIYELYYTVTHK